MWVRLLCPPNVATAEAVGYDMTASVETTVAVAATGTEEMALRAAARMKGYEGDPCGECGNFTLVRNGTCMKCDTCGSTSGCS